MEKCQKQITAHFDGEVRRKKLTEDEKAQAMSSIRFEDCISNGLYDCDFILESATENFEVKKMIFEDLKQYSSDESVIATNTSSIPIIKLADCIPERAHHVIGMHFSSPPAVMKMLQIARSSKTDDATFERAKEIAKLLGKQPTFSLDKAGFITNRILMS